MAVVLPELYYLENFRHVLGWVGARHADLLEAGERALIETFPTLPQAAQALLVRMVMRKGELFRHSKLVYAEIGEIAAPAALLAECGLIDAAPLLSLEDLFALLRKDELLSVFVPNRGLPAVADRTSARRLQGVPFSGRPEEVPFSGQQPLPDSSSFKNARKDELLARLQAHFPDARPLPQWHPGFDDTVYRLLQPGLYDRLRLMFFGNLHQDWSEFVLTDMGLLKYEKVEIPAASRAFRKREDVDAYLHLRECRARLEDGDALADVQRDIPEAPYANPWLEERRGRLLFAIGQELERAKEWRAALAVYRASGAPESRLRIIRVLEQDGQHAAAYELATALEKGVEKGVGVIFQNLKNDSDPFFCAIPFSLREEESQQLARVLPRLRRKLGLEKLPADALRAPERRDLELVPVEDWSVEWVVQAHLHDEQAPVFYVENALINSLFGLLCWPAIFAPVPGAFFHDFHYGPVDLHHPDFYARRAAEFAACFAQLESGVYRDTILATWREKSGIQSPFVFWDVVDEELLRIALDCIPPEHLRMLFTRMLADLKSNRSGFPDLIQFWPAEQRYLMLEVKGPGDRLQDNQIRWLDYCVRHGIPVAVSHVTWKGAA